LRAALRLRRGAIAVCALAVWLTVFPVFAEAPDPPQAPRDEETRTILEKSLSIVELDKEIARIEEQKSAISTALNSAEAKLAGQEKTVEQKREDAGRVLRAYYAGERDILLYALLSADSFSGLMTILDYLDTIFSSDKQTLDSYLKEYRELKTKVKQLDRQSAELDDIGRRLKAQRERMLQLQQDVDSSVNGRSDADRLRQLIGEITDFWQNVGLYEVKQYFNALAAAMKKLPEWVQDNKDMLQIDGFTYTLTIPEDKLNDFLRSQNPLFDNFSFSFGQGIVSVNGKRDSIEVGLAGHYTVQASGSLMFHVDRLLFNGLELPDTTRQSIEQQFDLGFYPQKIVSFLKAKSVTVEDGKLIVVLSVSL
jgi:hypothetical protein